jgi:hypothetical protein
MDGCRQTRRKTHQPGENVHKFMGQEAKLRVARDAVLDNEKVDAVAKWAHMSEIKMNNAKLARDTKACGQELKEMSRLETAQSVAID